MSLSYSRGNNRIKRIGAVACLASALLMATVSARAAATYHLTELSFAGESGDSIGYPLPRTIHSTGAAINNSGQVTGTARTASGEIHAFLWDGAAMQDLGSLGGGASFGTAINASGQVTGYSQLADSGQNDAFLWDGTAMRDLGTLGYDSRGVAINDAGHVAGTYVIQGPNVFTYLDRAFLWEGTAMQDLGTPGNSSDATAINASGQIAGTAYTRIECSSYPVPCTLSDPRAFLWDGAETQDLGTLPSSASAMNTSGQITGYSQFADSYETHAFFWDGTAMQDLGALGGGISEGLAINNSGQVTGSSYIGQSNIQHAFLWDGVAMRDLGTLIDPNDPLMDEFISIFDEEGHAINASGQVTGLSDTTFRCHYSFIHPEQILYCDGDNPHAFISDNGAEMQDLNALVNAADPLQPFVTLTNGVAINDAGQIVAQGFDSRTNLEHAYFITAFLMPSGLTATATKRSIDLTWQDNSGNEDGFRVERHGGTGAWSQVATTAANVTAYSDTSVAHGTTYEYRVYAFGPGGSSTASSSASAQLLKQNDGGNGSFDGELAPLLLALLALRRRRGNASNSVRHPRGDADSRDNCAPP